MQNTAFYVAIFQFNYVLWSLNGFPEVNVTFCDIIVLLLFYGSLSVVEKH